MNWANSIQNAINYIEEHLTENIDYDKVAKEAAASSFYFQKIFGILCGYSLGEYIRNRRLTLAGKELASSRSKVIVLHSNTATIPLKALQEHLQSFTAFPLLMQRKPAQS